MEYNKISAYEFILDESNEDDMLFLEYCKKYDKVFASHIDKIEVDLNTSETDDIITCCK